MAIATSRHKKHSENRCLHAPRSIKMTTEIVQLIEPKFRLKW
ncbi:MAG: hypothetical protein ACI9CO_002536, partial [Candidatus Azotimanducaceae bacterium]